MVHLVFYDKLKSLAKNYLNKLAQLHHSHLSYVLNFDMAANRVILLGLLVLVMLDIFLNYERANRVCNQNGGRQELVKTMNSFADKPPVATDVKNISILEHFSIMICA